MDRYTYKNIDTSADRKKDRGTGGTREVLGMFTTAGGEINLLG